MNKADHDHIEQKNKFFSRPAIFVISLDAIQVIAVSKLDDSENAGYAIVIDFSSGKAEGYLFSNFEKFQLEYDSLCAAFDAFKHGRGNKKTHKLRADGWKS